ncbi:MAG: OsmC family protein [Candidatus Omnitrophica bacterium]|nr:OsmC family protein [Candidatus Omnitrophota bacterium]
METKVELRFLKGDAFEVKTHTNEVTMYVDKKKEGQPAGGANPLELFLSSLAACVGVYALRYLTTHTIDFKQLNAVASADFSQDTPARLVNIKVNVHTDAKLADKQDVFLRFIRNCPIHNTVIHTQEVEIDLV